MHIYIYIYIYEHTCTYSMYTPVYYNYTDTSITKINMFHFFLLCYEEVCC
uniref:Uncharacterized protein n=1 Tax=Octopus bimaculoides TaxID=37653 RepID=A0A0L8HHG6_OCTBM